MPSPCGKMRLCGAAPPRYIEAMNASSRMTRHPFLVTILAAGLLAVLAGATFAMWIDKGAPILRALAESRMGWCL